MFGDKSVAELTDDEIELLAKEIPTVEYKTGLTVMDALTESGVVPSKSEARRLIQGQAISVNGAKIEQDVSLNGLSLIKRGRNKFVLVK